MKPPAQPLMPRRYIVGVFDMVGQSNIFQTMTFTPGQPASDTPLAAALRETTGFLQWFRTSFQSSFEQAPFKKNPLAPYDKNLHTIETLLAEAEMKSQAFNDLVAPFALIPETGHHLRALGTIYRMLYSAGALVVMSLAGGRAVRGGLDVESGAEYQPGEIYGRALNEALRLQMRLADYPRVLVGDGLCRELQRIADDPEPSVFGEQAREFAKRCLGMLVADQDGRMMLHYLANDFPLPAVDQAAWLQAKAFVAQQEAAWSAAGQTQLAERYARLDQYWERYGSGRF
ncbi:MAG TPA: hypothetical protein VMU17_00805 [Elusimicrobiota bacterium]|nr:hypothetical protein [Elusimicrobiota bacterium]